MLDPDATDEALPGVPAASPTRNRQSLYALDDDALVRRLRAGYREDLDMRAEQRKRQKTDWRMYAGDQWEADARDTAASAKRPLLTHNYILSTVSAVEGEERLNRQEIKIYGTEASDDDGAEGFNLLIRWVMNQCYGDMALSAAFRSSIVCGEGWVHPDVDYFDDPEGMIVLRQVDQNEIVLDAASIAPDASDARRLTRNRWLKDDEIEGMFPGSLDRLHDRAAGGDGAPGDTGRETDGSGQRDIYLKAGDEGSKVYDARKREWLVLEHWWFEIAPGYAAVDPSSNEVVELSLPQGDAIKSSEESAMLSHHMGVLTGAAHPDMPPPPRTAMVQRPVRTFYQAFTCHELLLAKNPHPVPEARRFPYIPAYAYFDKENREYFGPVRPIVDTQRQLNIEQSSIVHITMLMAKGGWMAPRGAYHDKQKWENSAARPGALLEYSAQKGKPEPLQVQNLPRHILEMAQSRMATMHDISGVNTELTGQRVAGDAGVVMEMRKKAALSVLAPLFDNFRLTKRVLGRVLIPYIQKYVPEGRRVRVIGPDGAARYVPMTRQMQFAKYDAIVDETSETVNDRMEVTTLLQTLLPVLGKSGMLVPSMIDLLPIPPHIRDKLKSEMAQTQAPPAPPPGPSPEQVAAQADADKQAAAEKAKHDTATEVATINAFAKIVGARIAANATADAGAEAHEMQNGA